MNDGLARVVRLVGDGVDGMSGGGLPLPDAFSAALQLMLDSPAPVTEEAVAAEVAKALSFKEKRVLAIWGSWEAFTDDIIVQLGMRDLVLGESKHGEGRVWTWKISSKFIQGRSYDAITAAEVSAATGGRSSMPITVTAYDAATRKERDETAKALLALGEARGKFARAHRMSDQIKRYFDLIEKELEGNPQSDERPPKPDDEPDVMIYCKKGEECKLGPGPKPKTKELWEVYWSRDQWYWRPVCRECLHGTVSRQRHLVEVIRKLEEKEGMMPSVTSVMMELGLRGNRQVRADWDELSERGVIPHYKLAA